MDKATSGLQDFIDELVHGKFFAVVEGEGGDCVSIGPQAAIVARKNLAHPTLPARMHLHGEHCLF